MSEAPFGYPTLGLAPGLTLKHYTRLERLASDKPNSVAHFALSDKHSSLFRPPVSDEEKSNAATLV
jgi:hypothetical protein